MADHISPLTYRQHTLAEIEALPVGTILAMTWPGSPDPELFRRSQDRYSHWAMLTSAQDYDWERWTHDDVFSENALYAVIYQPLP
jgi:hypothetical protein